MNGTARPQTLTPESGATLLDDFMRRELRVGDPRNLAEVLVALQRRYPAAVRRIEQESTGVPVQLGTFGALPEVVARAVATPSSREGQRVMDNLDRDLQALLLHPANRDVLPELRGWRSTLTREASEGMAAAALAQDPAKRDRAFTAIRQLEEFARVARLTSTNRIELLYEYRRLATTIDAAAMAIRIAMGEALDAAGLSDGGLILPIAATEGRERKQGLIFAIRRLAGTSGNDDWPDAPASFGQLRNRLFKRRRTELLVYLREDELTIRLDRLLGEVERQDASSLRELTADNMGELSRLQELLSVIAEPDPDPNVEPVATSEALSAFVQNLRLFLELFGFGDDTQGSRVGARLTELALPLPLAATNGDDIDREGRRKLRRLVSERQEYAIELENRFEGAASGGEGDELDELEHADQALYHLDRAIDLMAQGHEEGDDEEALAAAHVTLALGLLDGIDVNAPDVELQRPESVGELLKQIGRQTIRDFLAWRTFTRALTADFLSGSLSDGVPAFMRSLLEQTFPQGERPNAFIPDLEKFVRLPAVQLPAVDRASFERMANAIERIADRPGPEDDAFDVPPVPGGAAGGGLPGGPAAAAAPVSPPPALPTRVPNAVSDETADLLAATAQAIDSLASSGEWNQAMRTLRARWLALRPAVASVMGPASLAFDELYAADEPGPPKRVVLVKTVQLATCKRIFQSIFSNEATS